MQQTPRPGSMAEANAKATKRWLIGAGVIYFIILMLLFFGNNTLHLSFKRAPAIANILGVLIFLGSYYALYLATKALNHTPYVIGAAIAFILGICIACGFNFGY